MLVFKNPFFLQKHKVHVALGLVNLLLFGQARVQNFSQAF